MNNTKISFKTSRRALRAPVAALPTASGCMVGPNYKPPTPHKVQVQPVVDTVALYKAPGGGWEAAEPAPAAQPAVAVNH